MKTGKKNIRLSQGRIASLSLVSWPPQQWTGTLEPGFDLGGKLGGGRPATACLTRIPRLTPR